ncbi:MAG: HEAT repeat domain-containing protein [Bacteroidales bacterium]|nr:HEAT repeat domain-containing protein [Bacteroidales bacterium]
MKKIFRIAVLSFALIAFMASANTIAAKAAKKGPKSSTVAVVVDEVTYGKIKGAVDQYVEAISLPDRKGVLVVDKWHNPNDIRAELKKMYENDCLEGAVFVGNIPIPMVRDAQHFATAFKRSQKDDWFISSIPTDRFYDDFDLKFDYIRQDSVKKNLHYYSLRADSPQEINSDIYSARIKAPIDGNEHKAIEAFLLKAVEAHKNPQRMNKIFHFGGHGYNSESLQARIDEAVSFNEQFPFLSSHNAELSYLDFSRDYYVKNRLMSILKDQEIDFAILHHHGAPDTELLSGIPVSNKIETWIDLSRNYLRSQMNRKKNRKDPEAAIERMSRQYGVPRAWLEDWNDPKMLEADSIHSANMDLYLDDMNNDFVTGPKVLVLDACFNGAFIYDDYIASRYIFNPGTTISVRANTVNTLQDIWTVELSGLYNLGVSTGDVYKGQLSIEQHLFGDPTFAFAPQTEVLGGYNIARDVVFKKNDVKYWREILENPSRELAPEMRVLAIKMLFKNGAISSDELLQIAKTSPYYNVRMEAFVTNRQIADENLTQALKIAMEDSYEIVRRLAIGTAAKNASPELVPSIVKIIADPLTSQREDFQAGMALRAFDAETVIAELDKIRGKYSSWYTQKKFDSLAKRLRASAASNAKSYNELLDPQGSAKEKISTLNGERNGCNVNALEGIYHLVANGSESEQVLAAEVLGWYVYSYKKPEIIAKAKELYANAPEGAVKNELLKSINRLEVKRK